MSRRLVAAAAQIGPIHRADSRESVVRRLVDLMRQAADRERRSMPWGMPRMRASSGVTFFAMSWPPRPGFAPFATGCNRKGPEVRRGRRHFAAARNRS